MGYNDVNAIRNDQQQAARVMSDDPSSARRTLHATPIRPAGGSRTGINDIIKKKAPLKGHEAFLKALELSGARVEVEKKDGTVYQGTLKHTDKYTLTMSVTHRGNVDSEDDYEPIAARDRVIFKHDISEFSALTPRAADKGAA